MANDRWAAAGSLLLLLALPAAAQDPRPGDYYEDKTDLGFKVKMPAKWEPIPSAPDDGNLIIKYDPKTTKYVQLGPDEVLHLHAWIVKIDRRKVDVAAERRARKFVTREKDLESWMKHNVGPGFTVVSDKETTVSKVPAHEIVYTSGAMKESEVKVYAMVYQLQPEVDVAVVFNAPGEPRKWSKYENDFRKMARSFKPVEVEVAASELDPDASMRDKKRAELQDQVSRTPGWQLYETPNYFILSSSDDREFIEELKGRLEAIRSIYEEDYPVEKAREIRAEAARVRTGTAGGDAAKGKKQGTDVALPDFPADAEEASRCSVVRVCKNEAEYKSYGGPGGSAGYWSSNTRELVLYDDQAQGGRGDTWIVLNHEAFHQYIYYFYGNIAPHSWYNEGTGDFYSGYAYKNGRFTLKENLWRKSTIKEAIREKEHVPLEEFLRWDQREYYGSNDRGVGPGQNYAQGWSFIYFLRTAKKNNARGWDPKWDHFLEDYLRVLAATGKPEQAIEQSLTGIDVEALEAAWLAYSK